MTYQRPTARAALATCLLACLPVVGGATDRPDVILLTVDTLRADYLSSYGYPHETTPKLDALAAEGVLFEDAITTIGKTGPAFASLFTSLYPPTHGARRNGVPVRPDVVLLAEVLKEAGYTTAAFISNWTLRNNLSGLARGFDHYDQTFNRSRYGPKGAERDAPSLTAAVHDWLAEHRPQPAGLGPLFLWVHYSEPHTPYNQHAGYTIPEPPPKERQDGWYRRWKYASEVSFVDQWIGRLILGLRPYLSEGSWTFFTSDHGESLGEHGYWGHGKNAHWPNLQVPLIVRGPGVPKGLRSTAPVSIVDLLPTIYDILDLPPRENAEGISLVDVWNGSVPPADRPRFAFGDRHAVVGGKKKRSYQDPLHISRQTQRVKTLYDFEARRLVYYDLVHDPLELQALDEPPLETAPPLRRQLANWYRSLNKYEAGTEHELSAEDVRQLESLGYIGRR